MMGMGNMVLGSVCQYAIVICSVLARHFFHRNLAPTFIKSGQNNRMSYRTSKSSLVKSTIICPTAHRNQVWSKQQLCVLRGIEITSSYWCLPVITSALLYQVVCHCLLYDTALIPVLKIHVAFEPWYTGIVKHVLHSISTDTPLLEFNPEAVDC